VSISPVHRRSGCITVPRSVEPLKALRSELAPPTPPIRWMPREWVPLGRDYFKQQPAVHMTSDTLSPARQRRNR
jgi:hypothetical protein